MTRRLPPELLFDSEASLRSAAGLLRELQPHAGRAAEPLSFDASIALPDVLMRAYAEICAVLDMLRHSRSAIERSTLERFGAMNEKLREVSSVTELAASDMLDGLDRAIVCIDRMDGRAAVGDPDAEDRAQLRTELYRLIGCLQFQDITSQQLAFASTTLDDLEDRIRGVAELFGTGITGDTDDNDSPVASTHATFDPAASTEGADERQALADEIFG